MEEQRGVEELNMHADVLTANDLKRHIAKFTTDTFRHCLDVVGFTSIHMCWCGLGWNLVQVPLQSTSTHVD